MTNQKTPESMDIDFLRADTMSPMPFKTISNPDFYLTDQPFHFNIPEGLTQEDVEANPQLKLVQHDLLVLTSFPDNTTLHWRPSWFPKPFKGKFWTLQSPPDVVSEFIHSSIKLGVMTRRARMDSDPPAHYLSDWDEWANYCYLHDVPADFLCEDHVRVMRLGLEKSMSALRGPKVHPLYPEPYSRGSGRYLLDPKYLHNLPKKFQTLAESEVLVVYSSGRLRVESKIYYYGHHCQTMRVDGTGRRVLDEDYHPRQPLKYEGAGRRWSHMPWTPEQEESCRPLKLLLKGLSPPGKPSKTPQRSTKEKASVDRGRTGGNKRKRDDPGNGQSTAASKRRVRKNIDAAPGIVQIKSPGGVIAIDANPAILNQPDSAKLVYHDRNGIEVHWPGEPTMDWSDPYQVTALNEWRNHGYRMQHTFPLAGRAYSAEEEQFIAEWTKKNLGSADWSRLSAELSLNGFGFRSRIALETKVPRMLERQRSRAL